ncbi:proline and serine-rich 1-like protein [Labeo rohita]|uniref:Proline and serine-rich 1-like protein n=1 Tax=Labeo rohita TaxID=84645 RepID=A0A498NQR7_LABRO|nr:proline and serine-rich 1-like protein [Labeo rohita]
MSQRQTSTSEDDSDSPPHVAPIEPQAPSRGRRSARTATRRSRRFGPPSPPPARTPADSPASSYRSATPTIPPIEKWTMASLKLALAKSDVQPSRKLNKAEPSPASKRTKKTSKPPVAPTPPPSSSHVTPATAQLSTAAAAPPPPATPGPAAQASDWPLPPPISAPPPVSIGSELTAQASAWPHRLPDSAPPPATSNSELAAQASAWSHWLSHTAPPPTPVSSGLADLASAWPHWPPFTAPPPAPASSGLAAQASARPHWPPFTAPPPAPASSGLAAQASARPYWPPFTAPPPAPTSSGLAAQASAWPHALPNTAPPTASFSSLLQMKPQYSLFTASPMPVPPNAIASEPPQVAHNIRAQILAEPDVVNDLIKKEVNSGFMIGPFDNPPFEVFRISPVGVATRKFSEIQDAGSRGRQIPNSSSSLFGINIPINHTLKPLLDASLDTILQAVSPRTLQSYVTAWRCFKAFHLSYNIPFPDFSLLSITSFISFLNSIKGLQAGSIKGYLSGIQFFHKLMFGTPSPGISNSQTSLLIRGIQRSRPTRNDPRLPITLDILTKCIHTLRTNYQPLSAARTLDAMFILAFFGFLRCSELTISSKFDPNTNPTISDLTILDNETISFLIKQSKTDQAKRGHVIYIFNLPSPIQPYQSVLEFLRLRNSQAKSPHEPLFLDEAKKPVTRFWFQKHLKSVLQSSGIPAEKFSSHSFRIGAATSAAQKGLSKQQIQTLGRWSSEAFQSYIRTNQSHIKEAHQTLIGRQAK